MPGAAGTTTMTTLTRPRMIMRMVLVPRNRMTTTTRLPVTTAMTTRTGRITPARMTDPPA